jgi:hypothetical protein
MSKYQTSQTKKMYVYIIGPLVVSLMLYSFSWITSGLEKVNNKDRCVTKQKWFALAEKLGLFDIFITIFLPFVLIFVASVLISVRLMQNLINMSVRSHLGYGRSSNSEHAELTLLRSNSAPARVLAVSSLRRISRHLNFSVNVLVERKKVPAFFFSHDTLNFIHTEKFVLK